MLRTAPKPAVAFLMPYLKLGLPVLALGEARSALILTARFRCGHQLDEIQNQLLKLCLATF